MNLTDRGISYTPGTNAVETADTRLTAKYRGLNYSLRFTDDIHQLFG